MKYRKKPVVIDAVQWFPGKVVEGVSENVHQWWCAGDPCTCTDSFKEHRPAAIIETLEGTHEVTAGDWIITGVKNEKYACKDDVFKMTYEPVEEKGSS